MDIPLEKRLKRRLHVEVGRLQDEVMDAAYSLDNRLVFHGGTCIWRCYSGSRFSEDLDLYCNKPDRIAEGLKGVLESRALVLAKFKRTANVIFAKISNGDVEVRLELNVAAKAAGEARRYEKINGSSIEVLCLSVEELLAEKAAAYKNRRFVRDLYDVYYLSGLARTSEAAKMAVADILEDYKKPIDERNLQVLVYAGAVPTSEQMLLALKRRFQ